MYRGISDCKKGCQSRTNTVKDEKGDMKIDSYSIFTKMRNQFSQLFSVHGVNDVRQTVIHTAESLVPEPSSLEMFVGKIKRHKSSGIDQIPA